MFSEDKSDPHPRNFRLFKIDMVDDNEECFDDKWWPR